MFRTLAKISEAVVRVKDVYFSQEEMYTKRNEERIKKLSGYFETLGAKVVHHFVSEVRLENRKAFNWTAVLKGRARALQSVINKASFEVDEQIFFFDRAPMCSICTSRLHSAKACTVTVVPVELRAGVKALPNNGYWRLDLK